MAEESAHGQGGAKQNHTQREMEPRSGVWPYFDCFQDDQDGKKKKARCKRCRKVLLATHGTKSLWKHKNKCFGQEPAPAAAAAALPQQPAPLPPCAPSRCGGPSDSDGGEPDLEAASRHLARMIALRGYDASIVEDDCFRSFVRSLNPGYEVPSRVAIEEMCDGIFDEAMKDSFSRLRRAPGRFSFAVSKAKTTVEAGEVIYIACHFIDDQWNLRKFVLHALLNVAEAELECTKGPLLGTEVFIEAVTDVTNIISDIISEHDDRLCVVASDITDKDTNSETNLRRTATTYVDNVLHSIARCLFAEPKFTGMSDEMEGLHLTRQERLQLLSELDLDYEWTYDESWCACYFSLEVLRKRGFNILNAGWFVELVCKVWEQVYRSIQRISASTSPTSNLCLVELFKLREILQAELAQVSDQADTDDEYEYFEDDMAVDVLRGACGTLDKAIQDWYLVWSVPLALDPRYKLRYIDYRFQQAFDSKAPKYVSEVTRNINNLYADYIKKYGTITGADLSGSGSAMMATSSADPQWTMHCRSQHAMTELDRFLQDPLASDTEHFDLLKWWKVYGSDQYPMVARMARDALAMPTCSKLSSDQLAQVRSIIRGYSKEPRMKTYKTLRTILRDMI